ncbi:hypothetical protein PC9H_003288 [Pleurotus ostreatus]|uniref:RING-type domain-containing protein n=1 Tax=Pleurotus ostreatus TaxID=5322 RepID=A0A8H7A5K4_PLEOS|nr:uncharacterized protein PC9H_003288 [Pleurotus ostreatus]KAF7436455.1 hypothetical protein PC9H_003288 [Pleurotus ostreatus]
MSSRDPMWYCHECHAEMRALMAPQPTCASCHGTFVEIMENPADDPREFSAHHPEDDAGPGGSPDEILLSLQTLLSRGFAERRRQQPSSSGFTFQVRSGGGARTFTFGGPNTLGARPGAPGGDQEPPTMTEYLRRDPGAANDGPTITGPLMAQYLMALLGHRNPSLFGMDGESMERGQYGDYVFSQEALDQVITQIMENSNSNRPVPAPDDKIQELPRVVLEEGSPLLEKDCAVCKDQFKLGTEDPDEQVVITLPCKHPFHEPCITPWLKSSGTCPVCRFALVPQPEHHSPGEGSSTGNNRPSPSPPRSTGGGSQPPNLFQTLYNIMGSSSNSSGSSSGSGNGNQQRRRSSSTPQPSRPTGDRDHIPGEWHEDLD